MPTKSPAPRSRRKAVKAPLTSKTLRRASEKATKAASRKAFEQVDELLVVREGWLVKVAKDGKVTERIRRIELPLP